MGIGSHVRALALFGGGRPVITGLVLGLALLLTAQAGLAQTAPPAPQPNSAADEPWKVKARQYEEAVKARQKEKDDERAKMMSAALSEKCRTKKVEDAISIVSSYLDFHEQQLADWKSLEGEEQGNLADARKAGASFELISVFKHQIQDSVNEIRDITNRIYQDRSDLKKLEAKPPCAQPSSAAQTPPPPPPGGFGALPPCGDVSAEIKQLTEELMKLSKEETSLEATLAKHTSEYNAAVKEYPSKTIIGNGGSSSSTTDDPRVVSARSVVAADQKRVDANRAKIKADKDRIVALYSVPPCPEPSQTAVPPTTPPPCYSGANAAQIAAEIAAYQAELDRLTAEYIKLSASPGTGPAMLKNATESAELEKKIGALKDIRPCPDPTRTATPSGPPPGANPPSDNEHGMAPTVPGNSGFGFGFGGFGFGAGSDEGQPDRGFGNRNRRP